MTCATITIRPTFASNCRQAERPYPRHVIKTAILRRRQEIPNPGGLASITSAIGHAATSDHLPIISSKNKTVSSPLDRENTRRSPCFSTFSPTTIIAATPGSLNCTSKFFPAYRLHCAGFAIFPRLASSCLSILTMGV
jgi:hypothetical protein